MVNVFNVIKDKLQQILKKAKKKDVDTAVKAYRAYGEALARNKNTGNQIMSDKDRLFTNIRPRHYGRMIMFFYDPKLANELPYYDRFPLIILLEIYDNGFLGMNLHYLPPLRRAQLLDALLNIYNNKHLDEKRQLAMSYNVLTSYAHSRLYEPCIKRYLYSQVRSRFYLVDPEDWQVAVLLPTERFEKASKTRVWAESMLKVKR